MSADQNGGPTPADTVAEALLRQLRTLLPPEHRDAGIILMLLSEETTMLAAHTKLTPLEVGRRLMDVLMRILDHYVGAATGAQEGPP